jgi:hypothetical protein
VEGVGWFVGCVPEVEVPDESIAGYNEECVRFGQVPDIDGVGDECGELDIEDAEGGVSGCSGGACGGCAACSWAGALENLPWNINLGIEVLLK